MFPAIRKTVLVAWGLAAACAAQSPPAFRSNTEIVVAPVTVVDGAGAPARGLTRDEFQVYDNDVRRPLESFWVDDDLPLTLGVLIDASESQADQLAEHRQTARRVLERILRPGDRAFVISVDEHVRAVVGRSVRDDRGDSQGFGCKPGRAFWNPLSAGAARPRFRDLRVRSEPAVGRDL